MLTLSKNQTNLIILHFLVQGPDVFYRLLLLCQRVFIRILRLLLYFILNIAVFAVLLGFFLKKVNF